MSWTRKCPKCNSNISYTLYSNFIKASNKKSKCKRCREFKSNQEEYRRKIREDPEYRAFYVEAMKRGWETRRKNNPNTKLQGPYYYKCLKCLDVIQFKGYRTYIAHVNEKKLCKFCRRNERRKKLIRNCPSCKKELVYTHNSNLFRANKLNTVCVACLPKPINYNADACKVFDEINQELGWNGQHALYNGEKRVLKYLVDYYEPNLNVVIEYDEHHHKYLQTYDALRQKEIEQYLGCKFYRIKEGQDWREIIKLPEGLYGSRI